MQPERLHVPSHLFTVRLWSQDMGEGRVEWRGKVQHVLSGEAHYFREWQGLTTHLLSMATRAEQAANAKPFALIEPEEPDDADDDSV